jgi:hypothetical protein
MTIFRGNSSQTNLGFAKVSETQLANAINFGSAVRLYQPARDNNIKVITFKNSVSQPIVICAVNSLAVSAMDSAGTKVGMVAAAGTITFSNGTVPNQAAGVMTNSPPIIPQNNLAAWMVAGGYFKIQGSVSNDNKNFKIASVAFAPNAVTVTLDTVNGPSGVVETVVATSPIKVVPFPIVSLFEVMTGDSLYYDMASNLLTIESTVEFWAYSLAAIASPNAINAIRVYTWS